jgi:2-oxoglutarate ferredoxin oxidoreductase subunit beta
MAKNAGCNFARTADSLQFAEMKDIIKEAIQHKWFSLVNIHQACPSYKRW